jgi:transcriptional regulator with XRE-family HTH domain
VTTEQKFLQKFGRRIADIRRQKGMTQERLAESVEVHRTYIGFIEQGKRNPSIGNINRIAASLGVSLSELFKPFK